MVTAPCTKRHPGPAFTPNRMCRRASNPGTRDYLGRLTLALATENLQFDLNAPIYMVQPGLAERSEPFLGESQLAEAGVCAGRLPRLGYAGSSPNQRRFPGGSSPERESRRRVRKTRPVVRSSGVWSCGSPPPNPLGFRIH